MIPEQAVELARRELLNRGYRLHRELVDDEGHNERRVLTRWIHEPNTGPVLWLEFYSRGGWNLFAELDTTNSVEATWAALDGLLEAPREDEA